MTGILERFVEAFERYVSNQERSLDALLTTNTKLDQIIIQTQGGTPAVEPEPVSEVEPEPERETDREAIKARLTELGVDYYASARTTALAKLLAEAEAEPAKTEEPAKVEEPAKTEEPAKVEEPKAEEVKIDIAEIRSAAAQYAGKHGREKAVQILSEYGVNRLPDLDPKHYGDALKKYKEEA